MALAPGSRFGPYEIVSALGAGGMGEVYRARDGKLQRDVALKLLPDRFMDDPERLVRFEREAQALAALNHPNVAQIFGFLEDQGRHAFVMELVEGRTLDVLITASKPAGVGVQQACTIAARIADAVEAAHAHGILHRDLKPANVMVTTGSIVKVLDFGLATARASVRPDPTLATITAFTEVGIAIGTPAYMSPEQARGEAVDRRTDVWAFGCLFFEMLAGSRAFDGRTSSDIMAAVLTKEPDWSKLPADVPPTLKRLLTRCLQKDTARRLRDLGDARLEIEDAVADPSPIGIAPPDSARGGRVGWLPVAALITAAAVGAGYAGWRLRGPATPLVSLSRFVVPLPAGGDLALNEAGVPFALSPDGTRLVIAAGSWQGSQLYLRSLATTEPVLIPGTVSAFYPVFSPDSQSIAFYTSNALKRVAVAGGPVVTICEFDAPGIQGGVWAVDAIYFVPGNGSQGIAKVAADGGPVQVVTTLDREKGEVGHRWPEVLPGGTHLVFTVTYRNAAPHVVVQSLVSGERRVLIQGASRARYTSGHLVYALGSDLLAVPFDLQRLELVGAGITIVNDVALGMSGIDAQYAVANNGTVVHRPGVRTDQRSLTWVDRQGRRTPMTAKPRLYEFPRLSADGQTVVVGVRERELWDQWLYRVPTGAVTRLTSNGHAENAEWSRDDAAVVYGGSDGTGISMFLQSVNGTAGPERLFGPVRGLWPGSWRSDGQVLAYMESGPAGGDISIFDRGTRARRPLLDSAATEWGARISPDDRWIAYVSNESGRWEVYLQPFPGPGGRLQISTEGGIEVVWARNGRELFYRNGRRMMTVAIDSRARLPVGQTTTLFEAELAPGQPGLPNYDVAADGRFVMVERGPDEQMTQPIHITLNWPGSIK